MYSQKLCEDLYVIHTMIQKNPDDYDGYYQAANTLYKMEDYQTSLEFINVAISKKYDCKGLLFRANLLYALNLLDEAIEQYQRILDFWPDYAEAHFYLGCALIATNRLKEGHKECEWRFCLNNIKNITNLLPHIPMWQGESLKNKKILLFCEQGIGDIIQFIRYAKKIEGHKTLVIPDNVVKLLNNCDGVDEIILSNGEKIIGEFNYICSVLSLPHLLGIDLSEKYIKPVLSELILDKKFLNVGIAWAGNECHSNDCGRSCYSSYFKMLQVIPNVKLYSLQKGNMQRFWPTDGNVNLIENGVESIEFFLNDFNDTANLIDKLDLVISVDTAVAHLAGAMGKPVWLLMGFYPDHRWLLEREDTPWYPSMRLFRQPNYGKDWSKVFEDLKLNLSTYSQIIQHR